MTKENSTKQPDLEKLDDLDLIEEIHWRQLNIDDIYEDSDALNHLTTYYSIEDVLTTYKLKDIINFLKSEYDPEEIKKEL